MFATTISNKVYQKLYKPYLFKRDPEDVHDMHLKTGRLLGKCRLARAATSLMFSYKSEMLETTVDGVNYKNPIGLSAGFDKNGHLVDILPAVGFGFMNVGSITYKPYAGNPKPRLYRLPESKALVVYYGLMNEGVDIILPRILNQKVKQMPINISIAKTNSPDTATDEGGVEDYYQGLKKTIESGAGSVYEINISCPNTFSGEPFTTPERLEKLLAKLDSLDFSKPRYLKMPINLPWVQFEQLLEIAVRHGVNGVVIGNLTKDRNSGLIKDEIPEQVKGGISGKPTEQLNNDLISNTYAKYGDKLTITGVGGVFSAADAYEKIKRGASLVQLITGMIYEGPQVIGLINKGLVDLLKADGYSNISEAVGAYHRK